MNESLRRLTWRLGRALYLRARGEGPNVMTANGELALLQRVVEGAPDGSAPVLMDVGANVGDWTLAAAAYAVRHPALRVWAFEPIPEIARTLAARTAAAVGAGHVHLVSSALSDAPGTLSMRVSPGGASSLGDHAHMADWPVTEVRVDTLDAFCEREGIGAVAMVKCDAEGFDLNVMQGAGRMLQEGRIEVFQFEYNHLWLEQRALLRDVFGLVAGLPYHIGKVTPDGIDLCDAWHAELERFFECNYALVRADVQARVGVRAGGIGAGNVWRSA